MIKTSDSEGKINLILLSLKPRQVLLSQRLPSSASTAKSNVMGGGELAETIVLSPIQKVALARSVAHYLKRNGFTKTFKKFRSEAEFEEGLHEDNVTDLESVYAKFYAESERGNEKVDSKLLNVEVETSEIENCEEDEKHEMLGEKEHEKKGLKPDEKPDGKVENATDNVKKEKIKKSKKTEQIGAVNEGVVDSSENGKIKMKKEAQNGAAGEYGVTPSESKKKEKKRKVQDVVNKDAVTPSEINEKEKGVQNVVIDDVLKVQSDVVNKDGMAPLEKNKKEKRKKVLNCAANEVAMKEEDNINNDGVNETESAPIEENNKEKKGKVHNSAENGVSISLLKNSVKDEQEKIENVVANEAAIAPIEKSKKGKKRKVQNGVVNEVPLPPSENNVKVKEENIQTVVANEPAIAPTEKDKKEKNKKIENGFVNKDPTAQPENVKEENIKNVVAANEVAIGPTEKNKKEKRKKVVNKVATAQSENDEKEKESLQNGFSNENVKEINSKSISNGELAAVEANGGEQGANKTSKKRKSGSPTEGEADALVKESDEKPNKKTVNISETFKAQPTSANRFQRINADDIVFSNDKLKDNSYWAKDGAEIGYGAKAQEVLGQVKGKGFRHEKTKKKRGSYRGGLIDQQSHSVKFNYSDDE